jgi:hypothetical protein
MIQPDVAGNVTYLYIAGIVTGWELGEKIRIDQQAVAGLQRFEAHVYRFKDALAVVERRRIGVGRFHENGRPFSPEELGQDRTLPGLQVDVALGYQVDECVAIDARSNGHIFVNPHAKASIMIERPGEARRTAPVLAEHRGRRNGVRVRQVGHCQPGLLGRANYVTEAQVDLVGTRLSGPARIPDCLSAAGSPDPGQLDAG